MNDREAALEVMQKVDAVVYGYQGSKNHITTYASIEGAYDALEVEQISAYCTTHPKEARHRIGSATDCKVVPLYRHKATESA